MTFNPLEAGTVLSRRYKILSLVRKGGMGATYKGEDQETGRKVAIKELLDSFQADGEERESGIGNFLAEMRVLKTLYHPQIPRILDHFVDKRGFFLVLEFVEGKDLTAKLEETDRKGLSEEQVATIGVHVCRVLDYLHSRKPDPIIHQDIKSSNIMERKPDGRIMVVDFGIARAARPKEGMMIGTPGYSPPEQHRNQVEPRSDIYALGATLHELSTGKRPEEDVFSFVPPNELRPELSPTFAEIVMIALSYMPNERFLDAKAFEEALQSLLPEPVPMLEPDRFQESCNRFSKDLLFPILADIKQHYVNECQTDIFPDFLDYFVFTLGTQVPYSLIVQADDEKQSICFYLKEGLLSRSSLGKISPLDHDTWQNAKGMIDRFLSTYEAGTGFKIV